MVFKPGNTERPVVSNNKAQKISGWKLGRTIRGRMDEIIEEMFKLLHDEDAKIRIEMVKIMLDRSSGKVAEQTQFSGPMGGPLRITFQSNVQLDNHKVIEIESNGVPIQSLPEARNGVKKSR